MVSFNVIAYNKIPLVADAEERFKKQLASANLTLEKFFSELGPLFLQHPYYAPCLIHRHFSLNHGERMVATDHSARPSTDTSPKIVAQSWLSTGEEVEHRFADDPSSLPPPPPVEFLSEYKSFLDSRGIDVLGVCYAPEELADGFMFLELDGLEDRERVMSVIQNSAGSPNYYAAIWKMTPNSNGVSFENSYGVSFANSDGVSFKVTVVSSCTNGGC